MSSTLPEEILDLIVDHLRNDRTALKACCLVSQPWVPRTRRHLFARVEFDVIKQSSFESWMKTFPDPSTSPARHARTLMISGSALITITSPDASAWLRSFHLVEQLVVDTARHRDGKISLVQLCGLSSNLRSLGVTYSIVPPSEVFGLICSFPLLEDLYLSSYGPTRDADGWDAPLALPKFTGLRLYGHIPAVTRRLLDIRGGLCISRLTVTCHVAEDFESVINLASGCSETLEFLRIRCSRSGAFR